VDRLGLDEPFLKVAVDLAGGLRRPCALFDGPGVGALLIGREEGNQVQDVVGGMDQTLQAGSLQARVLEKELAFFRIEFGHLRFELRRNHDDAGILILSGGAQLIDVLVAVGKRCLVDVGDVQNRLVGQEKEFVDEGLVGGVHLKGAGPVAGAQVVVEAFEHLKLLGGILIALLRGGLDRVESLVDGLQVFQEKLGVDDLHVAHRIDRSVHVRHLFVLEAAHHVNDGVDLPDLREKLIAESLPLGGSLDEACDVDELDGRRDRLGGVSKLRDARQPLVGNGNNSHIGIHCAEGIVVCVRPSFAQRVEDRGLSDVGETDETALQRHGRTVGCGERRDRDVLCVQGPCSAFETELSGVHPSAYGTSINSRSGRWTAVRRPIPGCMW